MYYGRGVEMERLPPLPTETANYLIINHLIFKKMVLKT